MFSLTISSSSDADQRIDKFVRKYLPNAPLGGIFKWLRTGKVKVNGKKVEQNHRIQEGDMIDFHFSPLEMKEWQMTERTGATPIVGEDQKKLSILYEDDFLMIINKPRGVNVHPGDHKTKEISLIELVQDYLGNAYNTLSFRPSLVHRIDRDTSGCIMIAKEKKCLESLLELLGSGKIEKVYHAIVVGIPKEKQGTIRAKLIRVEHAKDEAKVRVDPLGQEAITHYRILGTLLPHQGETKTSPNQEIRKSRETPQYTLIECRIETGRTHQIRVHMAHVGTPILGDKAYGNKGENSHAKRHLNIERQLLHARSLSFIHPITKEKIFIEAPYMPDMLSLLEEKV